MNALLAVCPYFGKVALSSRGEECVTESALVIVSKSRSDIGASIVDVLVPHYSAVQYYY